MAVENGVSPAQRLRVAEEKEDRFGQQPEVTTGHADQKKSEAHRDRGKHESFFDRGQRREDELREKIEEEREGEDDAGVEGEVERDRDRIGNAKGAKRADLAADLAQWPLHDHDQLMSKGETEHHRDNQRDRHFHDRPAKVLEMFEERLRGLAL